MKVNQETMTKNIQIANKELPADLVIKNAKVIDVFNLEILHTDVAIAGGRTVGLGKYEGKETFNAEGKFLAPSFIDGHVHIESSMVPPSEFAKVVLPHGVTTVITDPHEIGNVLGKAGIEFMIENTKKLPLDVLFMLPSCVPATPFENSGAKLTAEDLRPFLSHEQVLGLAEVMDYPSLKNASPSLLEKIVETRAQGGQIDGHLAGLDENAVNVYTSAGVKTDHECNTSEEALHRLRRGMYLMIREGSVAKDLNAILPVVNAHNLRRCLFCTDDKHIDDLIKEGSIDHHVRLAVKQGFDPLMAIQMATLNPAECYGLQQKGAIAPGYEADFLLFDDMKDLDITHVFKKGRLVARHGKFIEEDIETSQLPESIKGTVHLTKLTKASLAIPMNGTSKANIIQMHPNQLRTTHITEDVNVCKCHFLPSVGNDQLKIAVIERHHKTGNIGLGIIKGIGLQKGAIATTIAHDSHNIVAVGTNDDDILKAIDHLEEMGGGLAITENSTLLSSLPLPIAGLMSDRKSEQVDAGLKHIHETLYKQGFRGQFNPFLTLSFMTLPVIPSLKITDKGLFDVENSKHIKVSL
ncbi:adenine deaminase [Halobacillus litoralis]|uniref:adenine deaminase n=1 Tax=Halobacillus litoralis TaxID=45668 RepID=UPI0024925F6F|nr:adenine deaminase [Halobacillus litoralis]